VPLAELREVEQLASKIMPTALKLSVPLKIDVKTGRNWDEMEYQRTDAG
jgi:DNA polymerase I-like protein with 3'-5' exonuclease and polymerase domains